MWSLGLRGRDVVTSAEVASGRNPHCPSLPTERKAGTTAQMQMSAVLGVVRAFGSSLQIDLIFLVK